mgnify:CR=1 FL=1
MQMYNRPSNRAEVAHHTNEIFVQELEDQKALHASVKAAEAAAEEALWAAINAEAQRMDDWLAAYIEEHGVVGPDGYKWLALGPE